MKSLDQRGEKKREERREEGAASCVRGDEKLGF